MRGITRAPGVVYTVQAPNVGRLRRALADNSRVSQMPLPLQVKLLRVLQEEEIRPVGSATVKKVDVRVISATSKELEQEAAAVVPFAKEALRPDQRAALGLRMALRRAAAA